MTREDLDKLLKLPAEERLEIAQALWESVEPEDEVRFLSLPDWQRQILAERIAADDAAPDEDSPWDEVKPRILSSL